jgi:hypothetical protein
MKKTTLGALVLTLSSLVISAACASSTGSSKPKSQEPESFENWAKAAPSELPSRPGRATTVRTAKSASR